MRRPSSALVALIATAVMVACRAVGPSTTASPAAPPLVAEGQLVLGDPADTGVPPIEDYVFGLRARINSRDLLFDVDHGSPTTDVTDSAVVHTGVKHRFGDATRVDTLMRHGGVMPKPDTSADDVTTRGDTMFEYWGVVDPWTIDSLRIGAVREDTVFLDNEVAAFALAPFDGILGRDLLSGFDLEFNWPGRTVRAYARAPFDSTKIPAWLPSKLSAADCSPAVTQHSAFVTSPTDSSDRAEMRHNPMKRLAEETELMLPVVANGHRIDATFDSGSPVTVVNWAAARMLGFDTTSTALVRNTTPLSLLLMSRTPDSTGLLPNYHTTSVTLQVGRWTLATDTVVISDLLFASAPWMLKSPVMLVGRRTMRDAVLFLSYSTNHVCLARRPESP